MRTILSIAFIVLLCFLLIGPTADVSLFAQESGPTEGTDNDNVKQEYLHHSVSAVVLVGDSEKAGDAIVRWVETGNGYFVVKATDTVVVRIPASVIGNLRSFLESISVEIVRYSPMATDVRRELLIVQAGIESREEILEKNLDYIDNADVGGTLAIEKEITELLQEIEELKGRERKLLTDSRFARAEIALTFQEQALPDTIPSSFDWVNSVGFYRFMRGGEK